MKDPNARPSLKEILNHSSVSKYVLKQIEQEIDGYAKKDKIYDSYSGFAEI